jgi:UDP-N-acetylmuramyl pentapeptide phosphotransferase/UDP-N-acetylglucosamine-1-phosphate transferase
VPAAGAANGTDLADGVDGLAAGTGVIALFKMGIAPE